MLVIVMFMKSMGYMEKFYKFKYIDKFFVNYWFISLLIQFVYLGCRKLRCIVFLYLYYNNMGCFEFIDLFVFFVVVVEFVFVVFC